MTPETALEHECIEQSITEWALDYGITPAIIIARLERGQSVADAITTPMKTGFRGQKLASPDMEAFIRSMPRRKPRKLRKLSLAKPNSKRLRANRTYTHDGKTMTIPEWADHTGLRVATIRLRLRAGWSLDRAFGPKRVRVKAPRITTPKPSVTGMNRSELEAAAARIGIRPGTVWSRLDRGWTLERALSTPCGPNNGKGPGVSYDFAPSKGTGAGSTAQETPNITFSGIDA
ncbi:hypothetical protein [uncultured Agrobacterium sp.]|uniref:hypothetical protein n=1 Tax=uncultured Agrobacterium sp. TaxID=157277 RepID=UPI0025DEA8EE|nr:hypothetical protein [uncultured Agrobacterium sp.]